MNRKYERETYQKECLSQERRIPSNKRKSINLEECVLHAIAKALTNTYIHVNGARKEIHLFPILCLRKP